VARALVAAVFLLIWFRAIRRSAAGAPEVASAGLVVFGAFLLLTPMLQPWYVLWILPLLAARAGEPGNAWVVWLAASVPIAHLPVGGWIRLRVWSEGQGRGREWIARAVEHGVSWALLVRARHHNMP
jgi:hypothetical protein